MADQTPSAGPELFLARRYRCPHCRRSRANRANATRHINRCWRNPEVRACLTCERHHVNHSGDEACHAGVDLTGGPVTGCQFWEPAGQPPRDDHER